MSTDTNTESEPEFEYVCASLWPSGALNPYTHGQQVQRGNAAEAEDFRLYCEGQTGKPQAIYRLVSDAALRSIAAERNALRAALDAAQAPRKVPRLTDQDIADIGDERGLGTKILDAGYPCDMLWFDGNPTKFARAIESRVRELCGVKP